MNLTPLAQIADVTKAKAAVINEKLEWEELDKQEQVFLDTATLSCMCSIVFHHAPGAKEGCCIGTQE